MSELEFKIGDKVISKYNDISIFEICGVRYVQKVQFKSFENIWYDTFDLQLAPPRKFKVGDLVKFKSATFNYTIHDIVQGLISLTSLKEVYYNPDVVELVKAVEDV